MAETQPRLHTWQIDAREYARQERRRGRRHAYERLTGPSTALVVVDMVRFFVAGNPYGLGIVPHVHTLARAVRAAGGTVAWVLPAVTEQATGWAVDFYGPEIAELYRGAGGTGPLRSRLWPDLTPAPDDPVVEKTAASAFFPGRCALRDHLDRRAVDTVLVCGLVTNVCVESTVRDAATLGYRTLLAADACATRDDTLHNASLTTIYRSFGDVRPTSELLALLATS
ncbi:cysteine hydrolase [Streptacidiphilus pinicola]|uniref:Cysteine hydrolase n=1 Tax=Streptacidiphilus pinicola TaxID=2219663 RepID=A0A2X0IEQ9_9ACTN|nr:isochorismatase family cysteine hydrolase [Streptacidiphilus pinicola]RAG82103.1 cysteine hydrolase [Streptacidiphilus pinicola]